MALLSKLEPVANVNLGPDFANFVGNFVGNFVELHTHRKQFPTKIATKVWVSISLFRNVPEGHLKIAQAFKPGDRRTNDQKSRRDG